MKVKDLIDELQEYNPDAEITREDSETIELGYISKSGKSYDKTNTPIVFVCGRDYVEEDD